MPVQPVAGGEPVNASNFGVPSRYRVYPPAFFPHSIANRLALSANGQMFLAAVCTTFLITLFFFDFGGGGVLKKLAVLTDQLYAPFYNTTRNDVEKVGISGANYRRFINNADAVITEPESAKQFEYLNANFEIVRSHYIATHNTDARLLAQSYSQFIQTNYSTLVSKQNLEFYKIPCLDSECGQANYPESINQVISEVESSRINDEVKESILLKLESGARSTDQREQWAFYQDAFDLLRSEYTQNKDEKALNSARVLLEFMKANYKEKYDFLNSRDSSIFEIQ